MKTKKLAFQLFHSDTLETMKKFCFAVILSVSALTTCHAQRIVDGDMLHVYTKNSTEATLYQLDDIRKITFSEKGVRVWNTGWPTEFPYTKVDIITFRDRKSIRPTDVETIPIDNNSIRISYNKNNDVLTVKSDAFMDAVVIYNSQGQQISADNIKRQLYRISMKNVGQGVYVVKARGQQGEVIKKIVK